MRSCLGALPVLVSGGRMPRASVSMLPRCSRLNQRNRHHLSLPLLRILSAFGFSSGTLAAERHPLFACRLGSPTARAYREQLGNNRFLLSDGLVIARALNRTLVEFPMQDSRIATTDAELGSCDYWDCERLCS